MSSHPWKRRVEIGDCTLYEGDCLQVMPLLGKVDAVDFADAVVYTDKHEKSAKRQRRSPEESDTDLGASQGANHGAIRQRRYVASGNGGDVQSVAARVSAGNCEDGDTFKGAGQGRSIERSIHRRDAIDGLPADGREGQMQSLRINGSAFDTSPGSQPHEQRGREFGSAVQPLPHKPSQARMVGFPEGWAILTDPPYGIGAAAEDFIGTKKRKNAKCAPRDYGHANWDDQPADMDWFNGSVPAIIWGGNFLALPPTRRWLIWDKINDGMGLADCEIAWTNTDGAIRLFRHEWVGFRRGAEKAIARVHPTQKPVELMKWCLGFLPDAKVILDPFMGSGTTLVACAKLGRKGIGIELDPDYFDIACERVRKAYEQPDLFIQRAEDDAKQESLDL